MIGFPKSPEASPLHVKALILESAEPCVEGFGIGALELLQLPLQCGRIGSAYGAHPLIAPIEGLPQPGRGGTYHVVGHAGVATPGAAATCDGHPAPAAMPLRLLDQIAQL